MFSELSDEELLNQYHQLDKEIKLKAFSRFIRYNSRDTELVLQLDEKLKFIEIACTVAYLAKCNIEDTFGPVKTWDVFIYNYLKKINQVIPPQKSNPSSDFEGAWVKEPVPGMYGWTMSFDFAALYPSIIRQWNMSPETIIGMESGITPSIFLDRCIENENIRNVGNYTIAANGAKFRKDIQGVIPRVIKIIIEARKSAKNEMLRLEQEFETTKNYNFKNKIAALNAEQMALKILANSLYGAISQIGFRYYDLRIAEAITLTGQVSDKHIERSLNVFMNKIIGTEKVDYVIAADTDSCILHVQSLVDKFAANKTLEQTITFLDKVGSDKFKGVLDKSINTVYSVGNCYEPVMDMKREAIASKAIWTAKKRYAMMVHNSEGVSYSPYKLKIMGMDLIKSSTPKIIRDKLKAALVIIFEKDQQSLIDYVNSIKTEFMKMTPEEVAFPRSVTDIDKWFDDKTLYKSRCPIHVRGSLIYNKLIAKNEDIDSIKNGDKIKFIYLKTPNTLREDVIAFPSYGKSNDYLWSTLGINKYIDHEKQWEKTFLAPLKGITEAIKWEYEKKSNLDKFFS
jgi:DNA polymerase elongation subunit (family B)